MILCVRGLVVFAMALVVGLYGCADGGNPGSPESVTVETGGGDQIAEENPTTPTTPAEPGTVTSRNLIEEAGFEKGIDERFGPMGTEVEFSRSEEKPIEGKASLALRTGTYGSGVRWTYAVTDQDVTFKNAKVLRASARIRGDQTSILNRLSLCATAEYTDGFRFISCSSQPRASGQTATGNVQLNFDPARKLDTVSVSLESRGIGTVVHTIDRVSATVEGPTAALQLADDVPQIYLGDDFKFEKDQ